jgi:hypothetical protein
MPELFNRKPARGQRTLTRSGAAAPRRAVRIRRTRPPETGGASASRRAECAQKIEFEIESDAARERDVEYGYDTVSFRAVQTIAATSCDHDVGRRRHVGGDRRTGATKRGSTRLPTDVPPMNAASSSPTEIADEPMTSWSS